jgi:hypothetical protein
MAHLQDISISSLLCRALADRCRDPNVAWPYHPRKGIGQIIIDCLLECVLLQNASFKRAIEDGNVALKVNTVTGGKRRSKRLDLVMSSTSLPHLVAVEAKACMTAHSKARTRLVAELTSSLDAVQDKCSPAKLFVVVVVNCSERFTSPLNLPGPNVHDISDGQDFSDALVRSLSNNPDIAGLLVVPIRFDNETYCIPVPDSEFRRPMREADFVNFLVSSLII